MKKAFPLLVLISLYYSTLIQAQSNEPFARFPSISPDGSTVAFSYQGDIWSVPSAGGHAYRLTIHNGYDVRPQWSPDGNSISFISDRHGNDDVFVMNADGSQIKRLTYHSHDDELTGWTTGDEVIFTTNRTYNQVEWDPEIQTVPVRGGTPTRFFDAFGRMAKMSPNGRYLIFVRGYNKEYRKGYHGSANKDLWAYDRQDSTYQQLTDFKGNDLYPTFGSKNTLYFISERGGTKNIYKTSFTGQGTFSSSPERLTNLRDDGVRYFDVSNNGRIVFESKTGLYIINQHSKSIKQLRVDVSEDKRYNNKERKSFSRDAKEFVVSPSGKFLAFVVKGEIFVKKNDPGNKRSVKLTDHSSRDRDIAFLDDSTLIFASDRDGQYDLYLLQSSQKDRTGLFESLRFKITPLTSTDQDERHPKISPNGKKMAYNRGKGQLITAAISRAKGLSNKITLLDNNWALAEDIAWSPDSIWLAYSLPDLNFNREIYIQSADNSHKAVNISKHPRADTHPVWSPDGTKLAFLSSRNNGDDDIWFAWLNRRDWQRTQLNWSKSERPKKIRAKDTANVQVNIDFEGLYKRLYQVTSLPGNESDIAISKDGQTFYFVTNRDSRQKFRANQDLYQAKWDGTGLKALTNGNKKPYAVRLATKRNALYFMQNRGHIARFDIKKNNLKKLPYNAQVTINHKEQREQIFEEAWRTINNKFYDPDFHEHNWQQIHDHYRAWALKASSDRDFKDVMNMMLGELNASHMGFYNSKQTEKSTDRTGLLGVDIKPTANGVTINRVVPNSPADREVSRLYKGERILAVDDQPVSKSVNFYSLLANKVDQPTLLTVKDRKGTNRDVIIEPSGNLDNELYNEWVEKRKQLTDMYSNGRLGYIHIEGMNWPSFERFERELSATGEGKEGIVIDVRYNGGGWTTDYLLTVLSYRQHAYTIPRGATDNLRKYKTQFRSHYPFGERLPLSSWTHPSIALANQDSYSNAEIFAHAYKNLNLGTLVGEPTFGAVISTDEKSLLGDDYIRVPYRGWYVKATNENMEHGPAIPDIKVANSPDYRTKIDTQLQRAVNELLQQIDDEN